MEGLHAILICKAAVRLSQAADCQSVLNTLCVCRPEGSWRVKREQDGEIIALFLGPD